MAVPRLGQIEGHHAGAQGISDRCARSPPPTALRAARPQQQQDQQHAERPGTSHRRRASPAKDCFYARIRDRPAIMGTSG